MLTLALDTATRVCSVAVVREQEILAAYDVTMGFTHSESLLPQIDQLFSRTGLAKTDIEKIAVSIGPGSFTGLRIGLAAAEGLVAEDLLQDAVCCVAHAPRIPGVLRRPWNANVSTPSVSQRRRPSSSGNSSRSARSVTRMS